MNESFVKYLAGLLDADGHMSFTANKGHTDGRVRIGLALKLVSADVIDRHGFVPGLAKATGFGNSSKDSRGYNVWHVANRSDLEMLLPRIVKHMVVKGQHWNWLLTVWRDLRSRDHGERSISRQDWDVLAQAMRESRKLRVGPLKPKSFPTWAWLAGYLDGDGCYSFRTSQNHNMRLSVTAHITDVSVLEFLRNSFGGTIKPHSRTENVKVWWRGLGPQNASFALRFLPKLVKHSRLKKHKIEQMIHYHQQRLSALAPAGEATV